MTRCDDVRSPIFLLNVLLVEDSPMDADLVKEAIHERRLPIKLHHVVDGQQALEFFTVLLQQGEHENLALAILDINLPKIDGLEVLRSVRIMSEFEHLPIVVMSSSNSPGDHYRAAHMNAVYFHKPSVLEEFFKIADVLEEALVNALGAAWPG